MFWLLITSILWLVITGITIYCCVKMVIMIRQADGKVFQTVVLSKGFWMLLFWAFTTAGFMMFIVEETMQVRGFGRYGLQQGKLWTEAAEAANYSIKAMEKDKRIIRFLSFINPPAGYVFGRYVEAEEKKLQWEMKRIEKELKKLSSRVEIIEERFSIKPLDIPLPKAISKVEAKPASVIFPIATPDGGLRYPRQVDYKTHAERLNRTQPEVYITASGSKYHKIDCRWVKGRSGIRKVSISEARSDDKEPCLTCKPKG